MPDHIASSLKLTEWLTGQGIPPIEVDEFAPVVWSGDMGQLLVSARRDAINAIYKINEERGEFDCVGKIVCPFFGPGGADNSIKALRAWCKKNGFLLQQLSNGNHLGWKIVKPHRGIEKNPIGFDKKTYWTSTIASIAARETDGIALRDLLVKLMEETK